MLTLLVNLYISTPAIASELDDEDSKPKQPTAKELRRAFLQEMKSNAEAKTATKVKYAERAQSLDFSTSQERERSTSLLDYSNIRERKYSWVGDQSE